MPLKRRNLILISSMTAATALTKWLEPRWPEAIAQTSGPRTLTFWLNAFIPETISSLTRTVPGSGPHAGKTMIPGPIPGVSDCFLTDQRSFSNRRRASSRMHSEITVNLNSATVIDQIHRCDPTIEVDCEDGDEECRETASTSRMSFRDFQVVASDASSTEMQVRLAAAANNGCFTGSPDIDYQGTLTLNVASNQGQLLGVEVGFDGLIEPFPAFELYVAVDNDPGTALYTRSPIPGKSPSNLVRSADEPVNVGLSLPL